MRRSLASLALVAGTSLLSTPCFAQGVLFASASCDNGPNITVTWTFTEPFDDPPTDLPQWIGYDVYRRTVDPCSEYERLNAQPFPRTVGATHTISDTHLPPSTLQMYEYLVVMVDAQRQDVGYVQMGNSNHAYVSCPELGVPISIGSLVDFGWALQFVPCEGFGTCYPGGLIEGPVADELRPYVGQGSHFALIGDLGCGTVEGCFFDVSDWFFTSCEPLPTVPATLGRLKALYR